MEEEKVNMIGMIVKVKPPEPPNEWEMTHIKDLNNMFVPIPEDEMEAKKDGWIPMYYRRIQYCGYHTSDRIRSMYMMSSHKINNYGDQEYKYDIRSFVGISKKRKNQIYIGVSGIIIADNKKEFLKEVIRLLKSLFKDEIP